MEHSKNVVSSDKIIGENVKNDSGENLGKIDSLIIDKLTGQVYYVTMGVGGFLGIGEKIIAVPWNALHYEPSQKSFILNADKERLKNAKALKEGWSNWTDETWANELHQQFGTRPYVKEKNENSRF